MPPTTEPSSILTRLEEAFCSASAEVFGHPSLIALCTLGLVILLIWLLRFDGVYALQQAPVRRNRINIFVPLIFLFLWLGLTAVSIGAWELFFKGDLDSLAAQMTSYILNASVELIMITFMLAAAILLFARGLKGIGLRFCTLARDAKWSLVYLTAVYPLILIGIWIILFAGRLWKGPDFAITEHESIELLVTTESSFMRILVASFAILIAPLFEELLFRGYIQTLIAERTRQRWLAIGLTSLLFASIHANWEHRVGLFFLSCALGYAYERSGSLFRPIFLHAVFNGLSVAVSLS